jgi:hypothetical protein
MTAGGDLMSQNKDVTPFFKLTVPAQVNILRELISGSSSLYLHTP